MSFQSFSLRVLPLVAFALSASLPTLLQADDKGAPPQHQPPTPLAPAAPLIREESAQPTPPRSIVRVNVTNQSYDLIRPWTKRAPFQRRAVGPVLPGKRVLVTAELVANATYVELEKPDGGDKIPASVEYVDYESNLALIKPDNEAFLDSFEPLQISESQVGDGLSVWQLEGNGTLLSTQALLTSADITRYPVDDSTALLLYRLTTALQPRDSSFTAPVVKDKKLTGMMMRFDSRTQNADVIPAPVLSHFLKGAQEKQGYKGFPRVGLSYSPLRDPQLRRYAGLTNGEQGGVYVTDVQRDGAASKADIQKGDVITSIEGQAIDRDGNYRDPLYGKTSIVHYITARYFPGDTIAIKLIRAGKEVVTRLTLTSSADAKVIIEPYLIDKAPRYVILGGLVFQELNRQYLKEWGAEWPKKAPERFVYFDRYQSSLFADDPRDRIVILSQVLPSACTIGYEDLGGQTVTAINGVPLKSLKEVEAALAASKDGFHRIEFAESPKEIYLDAKEVTEQEPALKENYGIPALKNLN